MGVYKTIILSLRHKGKKLNFSKKMKLISTITTSALVAYSLAAPANIDDLAKEMKKLSKGTFPKKMEAAIMQMVEKKMEMFSMEGNDMNGTGAYGEKPMHDGPGMGNTEFGNSNIIVNGDVTINNPAMDGKQDRPAKGDKHDYMSPDDIIYKIKDKVTKGWWKYFECISEDFTWPSEEMEGEKPRMHHGEEDHSEEGMPEPAGEPESPSMMNHDDEYANVPAELLERLNEFFRWESIQEFYEKYGEMWTDMATDMTEEEQAYHEQSMAMVTEDYREAILYVWPYHQHTLFMQCVAKQQVWDKVMEYYDDMNMYPMTGSITGSYSPSGSYSESMSGSYDMEDMKTPSKMEADEMKTPSMMEAEEPAEM